MGNIYYRIAGGHIWDVDAASYIKEVPEGHSVVDLISAEGDRSEDYLIRNLEAYGYDLGELAGRSVPGIKAKLSALDAEYLTPRTMAGLATNDPVALERWTAHENEAQPLREKLAVLEKRETASS